MTLACLAGVACHLAPLPREAALAALREDVTGAQEVAGRHFLAARLAAAPALSADMLEKYEAWGRKYQR
jgi:SpoVK/Ycf46/Vps4 family AAA+-type ATPase